MSKPSSGALKGNHYLLIAFVVVVLVVVVEGEDASGEAEPERRPNKPGLGVDRCFSDQVVEKYESRSAPAVVWEGLASVSAAMGGES